MRVYFVYFGDGDERTGHKPKNIITVVCKSKPFNYSREPQYS